MFNINYSDNMILEQKRTSIWQDDLKRRRDVLKSLDYYSNNQEYYLDNLLSIIYPVTHTKVARYAETYPLTQRVIDDTSILFQDPVLVQIDKDNLFDEFTDMLESSMFNAILDKVNKFVNLTYKLGVMPVYRDGVVELDIITGDKCFVYQDINNPTKITDLFIHISGLEQTPSSRADHRIDQYIRWNNETQSTVNVDIANGKILSETNIELNPYGKIPIIWFTNDLQINNFWPEKNNPIIESNGWINVDTTNLNLMYSFQAYSTLVIIGMDDKAIKDIEWGPQALLAMKSDPATETQPSANYINPSPKLSEYEMAIANKKVDAAQAAGLSAQAYKKDNTSFSSGYMLKLSNETLLKRVKSDRQYYVAPIKSLLSLMMITWSMNNTAKSFPEDTEIRLNYSEITYDSSPIEKAQMNVILLSQGLTSAVEIIMQEDPDITEDEAILQLKKYQEHKTLINDSTTNRLTNILTPVEEV